MKPLTPRQQQVFELIKSKIDETGMPPTRAEIARELGFRSANAAEEHLKALARKQVIQIVPGASRGIRVIPDVIADVEVPVDLGLPLIGRVAAGEPILAQEHVESHYHVDPMMFRPSADFLLRVQGESMKNIGIMDGDLLAVHKTQDVRNGQVVVARVEDDVTVKRLEQNGSTVFLHAENEAFSPIEVDLKSQHMSIEGVAVGIIRNTDWM
ncbi:transcriptional repressor LexA [Vibrio palustris]|uniref:LexA repressor n=1 Tax=Vibrio palustris TaxID=1918946 RepID=A0A1R4B859_9VIBR|nr:transcriptional repressor LexA [Vibrio palustris]SJL85105.1 LexA repressor [Vibrio palustris]